MKKQCNSWIFFAIGFMTIFHLLCYLAIHSMWSGMIYYTAEGVPYVLLAIISACSFLTVLFCVKRSYPLWMALLNSLVSLLFFIVNGLIISITLYAIPYYIREFFYSTGLLLLVTGIYLSITVFPKCRLSQKSWFAPVLFLVILLCTVLTKYEIPVFNSITSTPVVYAVGDHYQIVFTSRAKGTGWITIDDVDYNDTYAGYRRFSETVHKITVPMAALDNVGSYTISTRSMILRGPFGALQGKTLSKDYQWRGVIPEDGLDYYVLSDTHNAQKSPAAAANYFGDSLDFLISCGDNASWIDRDADLTQMLRLAGSITKGQIPVIYARGNHETKGERSDEYYKYVGADGENFYYTFRIKNIWGVVLDIGEDHRDKYEPYYDAAKFNAYRRAQTQFLDEILANAETEFDAPGVDYRIAVCHIPITVKYTNDHAGSYKDAWIQRLNRMKLTILFGGHVHQLWYIDDSFEAGDTLTLSAHYSGTTENNAKRIMTNAKFPAILVSRRSTGQLLTNPEDVWDQHFWGLAVSSDGTYTTMRYTNECGNVMENITCPWYEGIDYGDGITIKNAY